MAIRFFDMFAGIGGFRSGLEAVGGFECIGHCEIDPCVNGVWNIRRPASRVLPSNSNAIICTVPFNLRLLLTEEIITE